MLAMRGSSRLLFAVLALVAATPAPAEVLRPGQRVSTVAGPPRKYEFLVEAGECAAFSLDQGTNDLAVTIEGEGGSVEWDGFDYDVEPIVFCPAVAGAYTVTVRLLVTEGDPEFTLSFDWLGRAEPSIETRAEALRRLTGAKARADDRDPASLLADASRALDLFASVSDARGAVAASIRSGDALYALGRRGDARDAYRAAILSARSIPEPHLLAEGLTSAGLCSHELGDMDAASRDLDEAIDLWKLSGGPRKGLAAARNNRSLILGQAGEFRRAAAEYLELEAIFESIGDVESQAVSLSNLGLAYARLGDTQQARRTLDQAVALFRKIGKPFRLARALINRGYAFRLAGDLPEAARSAEESVQLIGPDGPSPLRADALFNLGAVRAAQRRPAEAFGSQLEALGLYRADDDARGIAGALANLGALDGELGRWESGIARLDESRSIYERLHMPDGVAAVCWQTARIYRGRRELAAALDQLQRAIDIVESLRTRVSGDHFRISFLAARRHYFEDYIDVAMQMRDGSGKFERIAFDVFERARARGLLDLVSIPRDAVRRGIPPDLEVQREYLQALLDYRAGSATGILRDRNAPPALAERARSDLESAEQAYAEIEAEIEERNPAYAAMARPRPLKSDQIQLDLGPRTELIAIWPGAERSYAWTISRDSFESHELPAAAEIEERAARAVAFAPGKWADAEAARAWLSRELLVPALRGRRFDRLVLIVSGALEQTPFAALPDPYAVPKSRPLGVTREIIYAPSASVVIALRAALETRTRPPFRLAVFADPDFRGHQPALARLMHTRILARSLLRYGREPDILIRLQEQAVKSNLVGAALRDYRMILIASHIEFNEAAPELSAIVLSGADEHGQAVDPLVRPPDIYQTELRAELAAIIGCRSGSGARAWGEGVLGFARAFQYAGAKNVLATLWDVEEKPVTEMMRVFFHEMLNGAGQSPAAALRVAQDRMRGRSADPYFFAALKLYGDWR